MRHVKLFEDFSASTSPTEDQIEWLDRCTTGKWSLNHTTGLIDVGSFNCYQQDLTDFKGVAFGHVSGSFSCYNNRLTSLEGAPQTVDGYFLCAENRLTDLKGAPQTVGTIFHCNDNPVSEKTLASIFSLMKKGKSYQQALEEFWPKMDDADRILMYKDHISLTPEESRKYQALATVSRIKNYL